MIPKLLKIHCGNGFTRGRARNWFYVVASVFAQRITQEGRLIWANTGERLGPYRSLTKLRKEARVYAGEHGYEFDDSYGSLHNQSVESKYILNYEI